MQVSANQCRAARSLLNWTQDQLATNANVSRATIADFESNTRQPMKNNLRSIADCMFADGIEFIPEEDGKGVGVRFRERKLEYINKVRIDCSSRRVSGGLVRHLAMAVTGPSVARGTSFLKEKMGEAVFAPGISVVDDPRRARGLASKPFDGEGVATARRQVIEDGRLVTWLLDSSSGRQLELPTTGHASRGTAGPPSPGPTNLYLEPGPETPAADANSEVRAIVEIKNSDWDKMTPRAVRRNAKRQARQIWKYIELQEELDGICPGIVFPKRPSDPKRLELIEQIFEEEGIPVVWEDESTAERKAR